MRKLLRRGVGVNDRDCVGLSVLEIGERNVRFDKSYSYGYSSGLK